MSTLLICYSGSNAFMLGTRVCRWVIGHLTECWDVQKALLFFREHLGKTSHPRSRSPGMSRCLGASAPRPEPGNPAILWVGKAVQDHRVRPALLRPPLNLSPSATSTCLLSPSRDGVVGSNKVLPQPPFLLSPLSYSSSALCSRPLPRFVAVTCPKTATNFRKKNPNLQVLC